MAPSRREVLGAGVAATLAVAEPRTMLANPEGQGQEGEAVPSVGGAVSLDPQVLRAASEDFGHIVRRQPRAVLRPRSAADIAEALAWARRHGIEVAPRGLGHSTFGRSLVENGLVIDMTSLAAVHRIERDRIRVDAGASWRTVLAAGVAYGLTPPVLTNYLDLSVGGTLAVGGVGGTTSDYGMQTDNVLDLTLVTGDGRAVTCSATENAELFDAARAGLGQCGVITSAALRLVPAPERARRYHLFYPTLRALTADQRTLLAQHRFDHLQGAVLPDRAGGWRFQLEAIRFYDDEPPPDAALLEGLEDDRAAAVVADLAYAESQDALAEFERVLRANGQWFEPHPWWFSFLPGPSAERLAGEILAGLTPEDVGAFGRVIYYPMFKRAVRTPLVRLPDAEIVFAFNIIRMPSPTEAARVERLLAANRALYERVRREGGFQYPVGALSMSRDDWRDHFGLRWPQLREAKRQCDPADILTPGYAL
jgi:FAD/FMN-containing dehydrogenase